MNNKKILVVGSHGLLGSTLVKLLMTKGFEVAISDISDDGGIDITKKDSVSAKFEETKPDFVVNCAAYTNVEACEDEQNLPLATAVNADGPKNLAEICIERGINLIHISTDYVFGENKPDGYFEDHQPYSALNKYGETKVQGEQNIINLMGGLGMADLSNSTNSLSASDFVRQNPLIYIVRTSALFGEGATNFIAKILQFAKEKEFLEVVTDEIVSPTYVKDLSEGIAYLIENQPRAGIYHYSGEGSCTRNEFAKEILRLAGIDTPVKPTTLDKFNRKAKIPNTSILRNSKFPQIRSWQEMLAEFLNSRGTA